jgi:hypothetical protein
MPTKYTLHVELDRLDQQRIAITLYAQKGKGQLTGLMNTNKIGEYIEENLIQENSSDPIILTEYEAKWLVFKVLKDWDSWLNFLNYDMAGQDIG